MARKPTHTTRTGPTGIENAASGDAGRPATSPGASDAPAGAPARALRLEWVEAGTLNGNPMNWRKHPQTQLDALSGLLGDPEIGWAGALLFNERTGRLIDGHARKEVVDPRTPVPVLIGNWSEDAEKKILATLDPIAGMAETDRDMLRAVLEQCEFDNKALDKLANDLLPGDFDAANQRPTVEVPTMYQVVIECKDEAEQQAVYERMAGEGYSCKVLTL